MAVWPTRSVRCPSRTSQSPSPITHTRGAMPREKGLPTRARASDDTPPPTCRFHEDLIYPETWPTAGASCPDEKQRHLSSLFTPRSPPRRPTRGDAEPRLWFRCPAFRLATTCLSRCARPGSPASARVVLTQSKPPGPRSRTAGELRPIVALPKFSPRSKPTPRTWW